MKTNPVINAGAAIAYIVLIGLFMRFLESIRHDTPDTILDGVGFLSLFVFSAAVMAFLFFYQPVLLLLEHKKTEALGYFLKTLGLFGLVTFVILIVVSLQ